MSIVDAPRGESLGLRARNQKADLEKALHAVPAQARRARCELQIALLAVEEMLAADLEHLSQVKASQVRYWLDNTRHFVKAAPTRVAK